MNASTRSRRPITRRGAWPSRTGRASIPAVVRTHVEAAREAASGGRGKTPAPERPSGGATARARASPGWRRAPVLEECHGRVELGARETVRARVRDEWEAPRGLLPLLRREDVRDRQRVDHDEDSLLRA